MNPGSAQLDSKAKSRWLRRGCLELKGRLRQRMSAEESSECVGIDINFNQPQLRRGECNRGNERTRRELNADDDDDNKNLD